MDSGPVRTRTHIRKDQQTGDASISLFQFRYDIDTIVTKYRDIDIDIDIKYVKCMLFADLILTVKFFFSVLLMCILTDLEFSRAVSRSREIFIEIFIETSATAILLVHIVGGVAQW